MINSDFQTRSVYHFRFFFSKLHLHPWFPVHVPQSIGWRKTFFIMGFIENMFIMGKRNFDIMGFIENNLILRKGNFSKIIQY